MSDWDADYAQADQQLPPFSGGSGGDPYSVLGMPNPQQPGPTPPQGGGSAPTGMPNPTMGIPGYQPNPVWSNPQIQQQQQQLYQNMLNQAVKQTDPNSRLAKFERGQELGHNLFQSIVGPVMGAAGGPAFGAGVGKEIDSMDERMKAAKQARQQSLDHSMSGLKNLSDLFENTNKSAIDAFAAHTKGINDAERIRQTQNAQALTQERNRIEKQKADELEATRKAAEDPDSYKNAEQRRQFYAGLQGKKENTETRTQASVDKVVKHETGMDKRQDKSLAAGASKNTANNVAKDQRLDKYLGGKNDAQKKAEDAKAKLEADKLAAADKERQAHEAFIAAENQKNRDAKAANNPRAFALKLLGGDKQQSAPAQPIGAHTQASAPPQHPMFKSMTKAQFDAANAERKARLAQQAGI